MAAFEQKCILLFVKAPVAGTVKTRLATHFSTGEILELYKAFVADGLDRLASAGHAVRIFHDPPDSRDRIVDWLGNRYAFHPQKGGDLGERMKNAFSDAFAAGCPEAVLLGSDIPDLPIRLLDEALAALGRCPAVIGPSTDGGYYLIGFAAGGFFPEAFEQMAWSTDRVFSDTLKRFESDKRPVHVLPSWRDIDTYDDLQALAGRLRGHSRRLPNTRKVLERLQLL